MPCHSTWTIYPITAFVVMTIGAVVYALKCPTQPFLCILIGKYKLSAELANFG